MGPAGLQGFLVLLAQGLPEQLVLVLHPQALVVRALLGEVLDLQQPLLDLELDTVEEHQGQVAERGAGQALWERAGQLLDQARQRQQELRVPLLLLSPLHRPFTPPAVGGVLPLEFFNISISG